MPYWTSRARSKLGRIPPTTPQSGAAPLTQSGFASAVSIVTSPPRLSPHRYTRSGMPTDSLKNS